MTKNQEVIKRIENEILKLKNKDFTMFFFTIDSKNVPNGSLVYTYELALSFKKLGYNVKMLYQIENELSDRQKRKRIEKGNYDINDAQIFCGVSEWMGEEYGCLEHLNISKENAWQVAPSDFLFIPEAFASLMSQTYIHKIPCQRYVLLQNFDYVTEFIPFGMQWINFGIRDCIATTELQANLIKDVMPYINTEVINPYIPEYFRKPIKPKKLIVNIISKRQTDAYKIMKIFKWKYPIYEFITFADLRDMPRSYYAECLKDGAITIWLDNETPFGYGALEAMRCDNIVIGKIPDRIQEWMTDKDGNLIDNVVWFNNIDDLPDILAEVIGSWMQDEIPQVLLDNMEITNQRYTKEQWDVNIENLTNNIVERRINELNKFLEEVQNKENKETNQE
jgi:hypothetical protein